MRIYLPKESEKVVLQLILGLLKNPNNWLFSGTTLVLKSGLLVTTAGSGFEEDLADAYQLPKGLSIAHYDSIFAHILQPEIRLRLLSLWQLRRGIKSMLRSHEEAARGDLARCVQWSLSRATRRAEQGLADVSVAAAEVVGSSTHTGMGGGLTIPSLSVLSQHQAKAYESLQEHIARLKKP